MKIIENDVLHYTSDAEDKIKNMLGVSDYFYALRRFDAETFIHSEDVSRLAVLLGIHRGLSEERLVNLAISGYLHDAGKIFTGIDIISKPDRLDDFEYSIIKEHPFVGYLHLRPFINNNEILCGIVEHHERLNGLGYPYQLTEDISEFGRILAIADVFSAMTSVRPYKSAISCSSAIQYMVKSGGFDDDILKILISMYMSGDLKGYNILHSL